MNTNAKSFADIKAGVSLKKQMLSILTALIVIPVIGISLLSYMTSRQVIQRKSMLYNADILRETGSKLDRQFNEIDSTSIMFCYSDITQSYINIINKSSDKGQNAVLGRQLVRELFNSTVASAAVINPTLFTYNQETLSNNMQRITDTQLKYSQSDMDKIRAGHGSLVWIADNSQLPYILFGREINDLSTQKPIGYFMGNYNRETLNRTLKDISYFSEGRLHLVDSQNHIIASNRSDEVSQVFEYDKAFSNGENSVYDANIDAYICQYGVADTDWKLVSIIPSVYFEKEIQQLLKYILIISSVVLAVSMLLAFVFARGIVNPIINLCKQMTAVGDGDFNVRQTVRQNNEIGMLYRFFYLMIDRIQELIAQNERCQLLIQKSELSSLRMQINPHFIYNTLESIKWIAHTSGNNDIVIMVKALGDFMRSSISGAEFVTLRTELGNIENYLTIQKYRYGERLKTHIAVPGDMELMQIPKLILQPLIENAIIHGLEQKVGVGNIGINASHSGNDAYISILDNGIGISETALMELCLGLDAQEPSAKGIGLRNVHQRIRMYYGDGYGLSIESHFGVQTIVTVHVPFINNGG